MSTTPTTEAVETTPPPSNASVTSANNNNNNNSQNNSVRKGRGSQVFTQEMACALVEMYYARKKDFPGSGYSLPPEGFEAIASELRTKFNVTPNEIDQQTLKKKLSNIRTRVRNRCRDMRPDADISGLNLTPSEKIYFRYFGSPGSSDTHAGESGSSTPLPNGVNDASQQQGAEQNGHSPAVAENNKTELPLNELVSLSIIQKYAENLHLFTAQNASSIKNIEQQRFSVFDAISKHLADAYHLSMGIPQVRSRIDEIARSLAQKMDDFRRLSGVNNENIVLRPTNMTLAESELFDAQFTESPPDPRKGYAVTSAANQVVLPPPSSMVEAQKGATSGAEGQQPLVQITDGFYSVILPSSSNGMPALPEPSSAPTSSMLISPPSSEPVALASIISATSAPIPLVSTTAPADPTTTEQASTSAASAPSGETGVTTTLAPTTARRPTARKNNKRKGSPGPAITDAEMERRFQETIEAVLSPPNKKTKVSVDEKRQALMAVEKQRTLRVQRQLAEEQLQLVRKQTKLADDQIQFYKLLRTTHQKTSQMLRNQAQSRSSVAARMPKLSNKQLFDLLRIHEENLAALRDCTVKAPKHEQDLYDNMCRAMQQRFNIKLSPIGMRSQIWRLKERVERKVNAAACKSGSTDEEVLLKTAGFTPVEAHLYKLLTDKVLPLVVKDQRELQANSTRSRTSHPDDSANQSSVAETPSTTSNRSKAIKTSPTKSETATPRKKAAPKKEEPAQTPQTTVVLPPPAAAQPSADEPPAKKRRSHKKKQPVLAPPGQPDHEELVAHSEPETTTVDAYMDTIERVAQMGRTAPCWYDEHLLDIRLPNLYTEEPAATPADSKKKKPSKKKKTAAEKEAEKQTILTNGKPPVDKDHFLLNLKLDPAALRISNEDLLSMPTNGPIDELQREKQLLCRTQRLLAAQRIALQTRQAEMLQSQTKFYDTWSGLASTFSSFFRFLPPIPQPAPVQLQPMPAAPKRRSKPKQPKQDVAQQQVQAQQQAANA